MVWTSVTELWDLLWDVCVCVCACGFIHIQCITIYKSLSKKILKYYVSAANSSCMSPVTLPCNSFLTTVLLVAPTCSSESTAPLWAFPYSRNFESDGHWSRGVLQFNGAGCFNFLPLFFSRFAGGNQLKELSTWLVRRDADCCVCISQLIQ